MTAPALAGPGTLLGPLAPAGPLAATLHDTPLGPMLAIADATALRLLEFPDRAILPREIAALRRQIGPIAAGTNAVLERLARDLDTYFSRGLPRFTTPLAPLGTPFQRHVWRHLRDIPAGRTRAYAAFAADLGRPEATRAVAAANAANPVAIAIPCHRLVGTDGALTGYGGGLWRKRRLLDLERARTL